MRRAITLTFFLLACGDDALVSPPDGAIPDVSSDAGDSEAPAPACEAAVMELGQDFAEILVVGACDRVVVHLQDAARDGCPLASTHTVPAAPGRHVIAATVPAEAIVTLEATGGVPATTAAAITAFGPCPAPTECLTVRGEEEPACAPARGDVGSVSLCGDTWLAAKTPTPGAPNDCTCDVDCDAAAPSCMGGSCVDGRCAFSPLPDGTGCDDRNLCTSDESCLGGSCVGAPRMCPDPGPCAGPPTCDPKTGRCEAASACGENAVCGADGCECADGFVGDGVNCDDLDECAEADPCPAEARCVNRPGGFTCICPAGEVLEGGRCVPSRCDCPWDDISATGACTPERGRLRLGVHDIWGRPLNSAALSVTRLASDGTVLAVGAAPAAMRETALDLPLCAATALTVTAEAEGHHGAALTVRWDGFRAVVEAPPTPDAAWALGEDGLGPKVAIGLAHRWFAAHGPPPRAGNRLELLMDHADAWAALHADLQVTFESVTGTSWWWDSDHELVRDGSRLDLSEAARWPDTILGALEALDGVERRILMNQFVSQDGLLSGLNVDDDLLDHAERPFDDFEYMGAANTASGRFTVTPPAVDFRARVVADGFSGDVTGGDASPFSAPIQVDLRELPLGLSLAELPIASWHQKFWTFDNAIAYVGGWSSTRRRRRGARWRGASGSPTSSRTRTTCCASTAPSSATRWPSSTAAGKPSGARVWSTRTAPRSPTRRPPTRPTGAA
jgi:hypothetical protein